MLYESLLGECEYTSQHKVSFWCHVIDTKGVVLFLIFTNEFVFIVLCLSFSFRYLVKIKLFQSLRMKVLGLRYGGVYKLIEFVG